MHIINKYKIKKVLITSIIISIICGIFVAILRRNLSHDIFLNFFAGSLLGFSIGFTIQFLENFIYSQYLKRINLFVSILIKTLLEIIVVITITVFFVIYFEFIPVEFTLSNLLIVLTHPNFIIGIIFGSVLGFIINFVISINAFLGQNTLINFLTGLYSKPVEEDRIFMFLDMKSSTTIAEKMGHIKYLALLNAFYMDIAEGVIATKGEIYKYVGDEAIITWQMKTGLKNANCIRCVFAIYNKLNTSREKYFKKYGFAPEFKVGIHGGKVVAGEMGYLKKEITFIGDVLNTAARIQAECNECNQKFLISGDVLKSLKLPEIIEVINLGQTRLRGKEREIELYGLQLKEGFNFKNM